MNDTLVCWKCGDSLAELPLPLERLCECKKCGADLHVCQLCTFYNTKISDHCDESMADPVREKERANFCDYFKPRAQAYSEPKDSKTDATHSELEALFGMKPKEKNPHEEKEIDNSQTELEDLFGMGDKKGSDESK